MARERVTASHDLAAEGLGRTLRWWFRNRSRSSALSELVCRGRFLRLNFIQSLVVTIVAWLLAAHFGLLGLPLFGWVGALVLSILFILGCDDFPESKPKESGL